MTRSIERDWCDDFDLDSREFNEHYGEAIAALHATCPVARSTVGKGYWVVAAHDDLRTCAQDWRTYSSGQGVLVNRTDGVPLLVPTESDPPYHTALRQPLAKYFGPERVARYEPSIRSFTNDLIDVVIERGSCDFANDISRPLPGLVFFRDVLGLPVAEVDRIKRVMDETTHGATPEDRGAAWGEIGRYVDEYLRMREHEPPREDVVDAVLQLEFEGAPLAWDQKVSITTTLLSGGLETTSNVLSGAVWFLATHPAERDLLAGDLTLLPRAVEEFLRYYASTFALGRTATCPVTIGGRDIPEGDIVMLAFAAANRDPRVFDEPDVCQIDRIENRHATFGLGPHRCIGSHLARLELNVALEVILSRMPQLRLDGEVTTQTSFVRAVVSMPVAF